MAQRDREKTTQSVSIPQPPAHSTDARSRARFGDAGSRSNPVGLRQRTTSMRGKWRVSHRGTEPANSGRLVQTQEQADKLGFVPCRQGRDHAAEQLIPESHPLLVTRVACNAARLGRQTSKSLWGGIKWS